MNTCLVDIYGTLDPPATGFLHTSPILERIGNQTACRKRRDRPVEIPDLDGMQCDIDHRSIRIEIGDFDPVTYLDQTIR